MKTVNIINLGCAKNLVDSEHLARQLQANNFRVVYDHPDIHPVTLINTCGFIHDAQQESVDTILEAVALKNNRKDYFVGVFGCLTQLFAEQLKKEIPEVDAWFGKYNSREIVSALNGKYQTSLDHERFISTPKHYAYLKIAEGCHRKCAFCSIPKITGNYTSKPVNELVKEAQFLASQGVKELILIAQDLTAYGRDLQDNPTLTDLVRQLSEIEGIKWIRLHYAYPVGIPNDLFKEMRENEKVCRYLDIPVQHIADHLLKKMKRGHDETTTKKLIKHIRNEVPGIALRTTMMVGFPGETDADFNKLMEFTENAAFERMGAFPYSHESFTYAFDNYEDDVPEQIKQDRLEMLMELQHDISLQANEAKIGKNLTVLIDREENGVYFGRSEFDSPEVDEEILVKSSKKLAIGEFYTVKITGHESFELFGEV